MEDIDSICSLESELSFSCISSVRIFDILKVIAQTSFRECAILAKGATKERDPGRNGSTFGAREDHR